MILRTHLKILVGALVIFTAHAQVTEPTSVAATLAPGGTTTPPTTVATFSHNTTSTSSAAKSAATSPTSTHPWSSAPTLNITALNANISLPALNKTHPVVVVQWANNVTSIAVTLNIAKLGDNATEIPSVYVDTAPPYDYTMGHTSQDSSSGGTASGGYNLRSGNTWEVVWDQGFANWTYGLDINTGEEGDSVVKPSFLIGRGLSGGSDVLNNASISGGDVLISLTVVQDYNSSVIPGIATANALLGDSTADSVLIFSPLLYEDPTPQPTYPNYTLPPAVLDRPAWGPIWDAENYNDTSYFGVSPNLTVAIVPTANSPIDQGLGNSIAAISLAFEANVGNANLSETKWLRVGGVEGFRTYFVVNGLQPATNYTFWVYDEDTQTITQPAWFKTKQDGFACPLLLPTDVCPNIGYASPVGTASESPLSAIPDTFLTNITDSLESFQTSLSATGLACGRDRYSYVSDCVDCYNAYRDWVCQIVLPQCAESGNFSDVGSPPAPQGPSTFDRPLDNPRNSAMSPYATDYTELQPCISVCTVVESKCPTALTFICPHRHFNADQSYAFIGGNDDSNDGTAGTGWPALDIWGNRWCSG